MFDDEDSFEGDGDGKYSENEIKSRRQNNIPKIVVISHPEAEDHLEHLWITDGTRSPLIIGIAMAQVGMILFNIGLSWAFTSLGNQVGQLLPTSFMKVEGEEGSPFRISEFHLRSR